MQHHVSVRIMDKEPMAACQSARFSSAVLTTPINSTDCLAQGTASTSRIFFKGQSNRAELLRGESGYCTFTSMNLNNCSHAPQTSGAPMT